MIGFRLNGRIVSLHCPNGKVFNDFDFNVALKLKSNQSDSIEPRCDQIGSDDFDSTWSRSGVNVCCSTFTISICFSCSIAQFVVHSIWPYIYSFDVQRSHIFSPNARSNNFNILMHSKSRAFQLISDLHLYKLRFNGKWQHRAQQHLSECVCVRLIEKPTNAWHSKRVEKISGKISQPQIADKLQNFTCQYASRYERARGHLYTHTHTQREIISRYPCPLMDGWIDKWIYLNLCNFIFASDPFDDTISILWTAFLPQIESPILLRLALSSSCAVPSQNTVRLW